MRRNPSFLFHLTSWLTFRFITWFLCADLMWLSFDVLKYCIFSCFYTKLVEATYLNNSFDFQALYLGINKNWNLEVLVIAPSASLNLHRTWVTTPPDSAGLHPPWVLLSGFYCGLLVLLWSLFASVFIIVLSFNFWLWLLGLVSRFRF